MHARVRPFLALSISICGLAALPAPGALGATGEVRAWGTSTYPATAASEFYGAGPVAFDGGDLFVADLDPGTNPQVRRYARNGDLEARLTLGSPDPYVAALAVDAARDRLYVLTVSDGDGVPATAAQVLVYSTVPDCADPADVTTCTLVPPTDAPTQTDGVLIDFATETAAGVDRASGLAVDPGSGDVAVLGVDDGSLADPAGVLQYVDADGTPSTRVTPFAAGLDPDGAGVADPSGLAIAPNGDAYVATGVSAASAPLPYREPFSSESVFRLPGGTGTAALFLTDTSRPLAWPSTFERNPDVGGGRKGSGSSIALSADGSTLYLGEGDTTTARVRGFSTADGTLRTIYASAKAPATACRLDALTPVENHPTPDAFGIAAGAGDDVALVVADFSGEAQIPVVHLLGTGGSGCATTQGLFTVNDDGAGTMTVTKGRSVTFDARPSQLLGGRPTTVSWDFDGSGAFATVFTGAPAAATTTHTFTQIGTYQVGVKVRIDGGPTTDPVFHQVKVVGATPIAAFTASSTTPAPGAAVTFDASGSVDPAGSSTAGSSNELATYRWDFGDGQTLETSTPAIAHAFANPAAAALPRTVALTVVTKDGVTSEQATRRITVAGTPAAVSKAPVPPATQPKPIAAPRTALTVKGVDAKGTLSVKVACPAGGAACLGKFALTTKVKKKVVKLGTAAFAVGAGKSKTIKLKLTAAGWKLLKQQKRLSASAAVSVIAAGKTTTTTKRLTLEAPAKKAAKKKR